MKTETQDSSVQRPNDTSADTTITAQLQVLERILELIPHSVFWKDKNSVYLGCNARFLRDANAKEKSDVVGKTDFDMPWGKTEAASYRAYDQKLMAEKRSILNLEETQVQSDGSVNYLVTSKVPILDPAGEVVGILGIYMDITELKTARAALQDQTEKAHSYSKMAALGQMAAGIAHEINSPLAAISGTAELAMVQLEAGDCQSVSVGEALNTIVVTTDRIAKIIKSLKALARNESGGEMENRDLRVVVQEAVEIAQDRLHRNSVRLDLVGMDSAAEVFCRETEIGQVLINMLNNSCDAVSKLQDRWVRLRVEQDDDFVHVSCTDSGGGIPTDVTERMFRTYFTTKSKSGGMGIGLSI